MTNDQVLLVPCIKLTDWIENRLSDFNEGGANSHRSPVPEGPHRDLATVTLRHFLGGQKLAVGHSRLLMTTRSQDWVQHPGPCEKTVRVIRMCVRQITYRDLGILSITFPHDKDSRSILMA